MYGLANGYIASIAATLSKVRQDTIIGSKKIRALFWVTSLISRLIVKMIGKLRKHSRVALQNKKIINN